MKEITEAIKNIQKIEYTREENNIKKECAIEDLILLEREKYIEIIEKEENKEDMFCDECGAKLSLIDYTEEFLKYRCHLKCVKSTQIKMRRKYFEKNEYKIIKNKHLEELNNQLNYTRNICNEIITIQSIIKKKK